MTYIKYKTSLCRHYELTKTCSLGEACSFAHGEHEKRSMNDVSDSLNAPILWCTMILNLASGFS